MQATTANPSHANFDAAPPFLENIARIAPIARDQWMFEMVSRMPMFRGKIIAGFLAVAGILAVVAAGSATASADAILFGQSCGKCHARASTLARALKGDTPAEKAAALDTFLAKHHAEDAVTRARIVAYLAGLAAK